MTRPPWEVADIIRRAGDKFLERYRDSLTWTQLKVLRAIARCRTAALGGHRDQCVRCGIRLSLTTPAETGTVQSARLMPGRSGCAPGDGNCCRLATFTWSSACRMCWSR